MPCGLSRVCRCRRRAPRFGHAAAARPPRLLLTGASPFRPPVPPLPRIERACLGTIAEGRYLTRDLGGKSGTSDFTRAIIGRLDD